MGFLRNVDDFQRMIEDYDWNVQPDNKTPFWTVMKQNPEVNGLFLAILLEVMKQGLFDAIRDPKEELECYFVDWIKQVTDEAERMKTAS